MNIAFLFNSDAPEYNGFYDYPINRKLLSTGVLQASKRRMRCLIGDITTFGHVAARKQNRTYADLAELDTAVYQPSGWDRRILDRLVPILGKATVYCWVFENMTENIGVSLHDALTADETYLGALSVDFSNPHHLVFFRNTLIDLCRLEGTKCSFFYSMGENEDPDIALRELFEANGYSVTYEDAGARRTIFDNYDSLEHFRRIEIFRRAVVTFAGVAEDAASDIVLNLEELQPYLFDILFAAVDALVRAETSEQLAQASLSGRRFLEHLADVLYPSTEGKFVGQKGERAVGKTNYRNRLWAFIETAMTKAGKFDERYFLKIGRETDRLCELFNSGLHHSPAKPKGVKALADLIVWTSELIEIDPVSARNPYAPYQEEIRQFALKSFERY
jgi:hypothetical protein